VETLGADPGRYHRDTRRKRLEQFHAHSRSAEDWAHEQRISRQGFAHVIDKTDRVYVSILSERMRRRQLRPDDLQARVRHSLEDSGHDVAQKPIERLLIGRVSKRSQE